MADITAVFFLIAITHGNNDAFTITELASFQSSATCDVAASAFYGAMSKGGSTTAEIGCLPASAFEDLKKKG